jgi:organic radical activating enzyme
MNKIIINEIFGPTVQGEGVNSGKQAAFIRLGGCNLTCTWCDTPYTWDTSRYDLKVENTRYDIDEVVSLLPKVPIIVISGGEPLLQYNSLEILCNRLISQNYKIEIETNGTRPPMPPNKDIRYNVSPKLEHAGDPLSKRITRHLFDYVDDPNATFKFVVQNTNDLKEVDHIVTAHQIDVDRVWIMPEGVTSEVLNKRLTEISQASIDRKYNVTGRLHIQMFGGVRGK